MHYTIALKFVPNNNTGPATFNVDQGLHKTPLEAVSAYCKTWSRRSIVTMGIQWVWLNKIDTAVVIEQYEGLEITSCKVYSARVEEAWEFELFPQRCFRILGDGHRNGSRA